MVASAPGTARAIAVVNLTNSLLRRAFETEPAIPRCEGPLDEGILSRACDKGGHHTGDLSGAMAK